MEALTEKGGKRTAVTLLCWTYKDWKMFSKNSFQRSHSALKIKNIFVSNNLLQVRSYLIINLNGIIDVIYL